MNRHGLDDRCLKWLRITAYTLMTCAGVLLMVSPVLTEAYPTTARVMSGFMFLGGVLSVIGSRWERWWGEYMGIPLLSSAFAVFALIALADSWDAVPYLASANFCLLTAVALSLMTRWRESQVMSRLAINMARKERDETSLDAV